MSVRDGKLSILIWYIIGFLALPLAHVAKAQERDVYSKLPKKMSKEMTTIDCAKCHYDIFMTIREGKGAHRFPCRDCHETFHSFRRGLKYEEVLPKCIDCHEHPHGDSKDMVSCKTCHQKPHAPLKSLDIEQLSPYCGRCHSGPAGQLKTHPGSHSKLSCNDCHNEGHGYIPKCIACHDTPHTKYKSNKGCMQCHPAHMPQEIFVGILVPNDICAGCHEEEAQLLSSGTKAHSRLRCVFCHSDRHGKIPKCQDCHGVPHPKSILKGFKSCQDCHGNPHDLELAGQK